MRGGLSSKNTKRVRTSIRISPGICRGPEFGNRTRRMIWVTRGDTFKKGQKADETGEQVTLFLLHIKGSR